MKSGTTETTDGTRQRYIGNGNDGHFQKSGKTTNIKLKQEVGLLGGVAVIVGTMIGSGIFISPTGVLRGTGSVGMSLVVWSLCGVLAMLGGLSYAELGTMIRKSGGEYAYLHEGIGPVFAYMVSWVTILLLKPSSVAVICLAFAGYVADPIFDDCGPPVAVIKCLAAIAIVTVSGVNAYSVKLAANVQIFFMGAKLLALLVIIIGGFVKMGQGHTDILASGFEGTTTDASSAAIAFYNGLWAYDGWNNLNYLTEELKQPKVNIPRALLISIPLVTVVYLLTNISYFSIMSTNEILTSSAVAVTWGDRVLGGARLIIPVAVACSTFGAANGSFFAGSRLCYVSAREGHLPEVLSFVHAKRVTPLSSLIFTTIVALIMIIPGDIDSLINFFSFAAWMFYGTTMLALLIMRRTKPDWERPYKVPIVVPILVLLASIYLVIAPIVNEPQIEFLYAFLFIVSGLIFYVPFVHFKLQIPYLEKVTIFFQLFLQVCPSRYEETKEEE